MKYTIRPPFLCALMLCVAVLVPTIGVKASLHFNSEATYRIASKQSSGSIVVGKSHGQNTPLYYLQNNSTAADAFWQIIEVSEGVYALRNASTKQYVTYTGLRSGSDYRYLGLTDVIQGDSSLWTIEKYNGYYLINSKLAVTNKSLNVRSSMVVGTYAESYSDNSLFSFYDTEGTLYNPEDVTPSFNYGTTDDGYYWENTGLSMPVAVTTDTADPILYKIKNVRSGKFVEVDDFDGNLTQSKSEGTSFYFVQGTDGVNIYSENGQYISGKVINISTKSIAAIKGTTPLNDNTWAFDYYSIENPGYGVKVQTCSSNRADNYYVWTGQTYWNDLRNYDICYYRRDDAGSTFVFYSQDERHREYLASKGISLKGGGSGSSMLMNAALDTLLIAGKTATYDGLYDIYMKTIPETNRNADSYSARIHYVPSSKAAGCTLYVDGNEVADGSDYTFASPGADKEYQLQLRRGSKVVAEGKLTFTFLPIVEIWGTWLSSVYHPGSIRVNDVNSPDAVDSTYEANLRYRGATASGLNKKAYAIKLKNANGESIDRKFLGMREDNNWILDAMAIDPGRMRNRVATDLWLDFSTKPYQSAYEKKAVNGTHGKFVEVLLNGQYAGLYCMTEKIDRKQLKLKKFIAAADETQSDTVRGDLYKSTTWSYSIFMGHYSDQNYFPRTKTKSYSNTSGSWDGWEVKYPDIEDGEPIDWKPLYDAVNAVAATSDAQFNAQVADYFDLPVFRDYCLFIELIFATDNHGKNMYLYNYDQTRFNKLSVCPWDLDGTFGRRWDGSTTYTSNAAADFVSFLWSYEHGEYTLFKRLKALNFNGWNTDLANRWAEMRSTYVTPEKLLKRFTDYASLFRESGAEAREIKRWQGMDANMDFDYEMNYLKSWLSIRIATLDKKYNYDPTGITAAEARYVGATGGKGCIYIHVTEPTFVNIYTAAGSKVLGKTFSGNISQVDGLQPGVYIVNNKKVIVR